jgi:hypothetical protein
VPCTCSPHPPTCSFEAAAADCNRAFASSGSLEGAAAARHCPTPSCLPYPCNPSTVHGRRRSRVVATIVHLSAALLALSARVPLTTPSYHDVSFEAAEADCNRALAPPPPAKPPGPCEGAAAERQACDCIACWLCNPSTVHGGIHGRDFCSPAPLPFITLPAPVPPPPAFPSHTLL